MSRYTSKTGKDVILKFRGTNIIIPAEGYFETSVENLEDLFPQQIRKDEGVVWTGETIRFEPRPRELPLAILRPVDIPIFHPLEMTKPVPVNVPIVHDLPTPKIKDLNMQVIYDLPTPLIKNIDIPTLIKIQSPPIQNIIFNENQTKTLNSIVKDNDDDPVLESFLLTIKNALVDK
jgi:hypothetical protein